MSHEVERMFNARFEPWHFSQTSDRTTVTAELLNAKDALEESGLDFDVEKFPLYVELEPGFPPVPLEGWEAVGRPSDGVIYNVASPRYHVIQHREMFDFAEVLLDTGEAAYQSAGSLKQGALGWAMIELDKSITIGDGAEYVPYLALYNSHDGSRAFGAIVTPIVIVCYNTFRLAEASAKAKWSVRHTTNATTRIQQARESLELSYRYYDAFEKEVEKLMEQQVNDQQFYAIVKGIFPVEETDTDRQQKTQKQRQNTVEALYYESPTIKSLRGTGMGVLSAFNEWEQWSVRSTNLPNAKQKERFNEKVVKRAIMDDFPVTKDVEAVLASVRSS